MRSFPLILALVFAGFVAWVLLLRTSAPDAPALDPNAGMVQPDQEGAMLSGNAPVASTVEPPARRAPRRTSIDPRTVPRGGLVVVVEDTEGRRISPDDVRLRIQGRDFPYLGVPLAARDLEALVWRFTDSVRVGPGRVTVQGDGYFDGGADVEIVEGATPEVRVVLERAGRVHWQVRDAAGTPLDEQFTLELLDADGDPIEAWYQERHDLRTTARKRYRKAMLGHTGYILGLKAAHYELRVTRPDGRHATQPVSVTLGEAAPAVIRFDR